MPTDAHITLLGPQRTPRLGQVVAALGLSDARFGTINAGWREREPDDELLSETLNHNTVNLRLWHRMQQVWESDPELAQADAERRRVIEEMQELYLLGLDHALCALLELQSHAPRHPRVRETAIQDAEAIVRDLDRRHLLRIDQAYGEFWDRWRPHERDSTARAREAVARDLAQTQAVVITGGHVGVLLGALHLFNIGPSLDVPVIAWGAGAMVLTERVVLFHDRAAHGPAVAELYGTGLGLVRDTVALPSPRERLSLGDRHRMGLLARRFQPAQALLLGSGVSVHIGYDGRLPSGAPVLLADGSAGTFEGAA
ncbi:MAG TPA: hypothetical protein VJ976_10350 [Ornithinimicrobium sp.]|uniref:hypothetical protein n=1 Tax=Ornithinimicrobium sp. TaxID=1977084 RepID=UPI002B484E0C|nr:hypothetical protein [Ornithinimicrobium sp.]HKJ12771.1 hypothetical protein [Ornithinimicrobium sp.]